MTLSARFERLEKRLKARTKANGDPRPGYEQNVASIRAELDQITLRIQEVEEQQGE